MKKQQRSFNDDMEYENDDFDETDLHNIWRKRRKLNNIDQISSVMQTERATRIEQNNSYTNQMKNTNEYKNINQYPKTNDLNMRPYDHQIPPTISVQQDDMMLMSNKLV